MPRPLHELQQELNTVSSNMRDLHDEIGDNEWSSEQRSKWESMRGERQKLDEQIKREEELRELDQKFVENNAKEHREQASGNTDDRRAEAFETYVRSGQSDMDQELRAVLKEMRAQGVGTNEKGGYTVPKEFESRVREKMKAYGGLSNIAHVITTSHGRNIEWATTDGTSEEGALIGENTAAEEQDVQFGIADIGAKKTTSKIIRISNELLADSGVSIENILTNRIGTRLGRVEARLIVQGTGTGKPAQPKGLEASVSKTKMTGAATKVSWQEMNALKHSVDPAYRNNQCRWLFNDNTLQNIEEMVDSNGKPLWLPGIAGGAPSTFLNHQYQIDQAVADVGAGKKFVYFGDFKRFIVRRVSGITLRRLTERYAEFDQTAFLSFARFDCLLEDDDAIKALIGKS